MSYFSKLWSRWFGGKPSKTVSTKSTVSSSSVGAPSVITTTPAQTRNSTSSRNHGQGGSYYDEAPNSGIDPLTVAIVANSFGSNSEQSRSEESTPAPTPVEPSSHLSPYESNAASHSHSDSPSYSHHDNGYSHSDHGNSHSSAHSHSSYDSGSSHSSYDSGSSYSSSDSGGGGGCDGGGGGGD